MEQCNELKDKMLRFIYGTLDRKEEKNVLTHLKTCKKCNDKINQFQYAKARFSEMVKQRSPNHFSNILAEGKQREQSQAVIDKPPKITAYLKSIFTMPVLKFAAVAALLTIIVISFFFLPKSDKGPYLYVLNAAGEVEVNQKMFFNMNNFSYELKDILNITVQDGKFDFQISADKLITLKNNTSIEIQMHTNIHVHLLKGVMVGKVIKGELPYALIITCGPVRFEIVGTVFMIRNTDEYIELAVDQGTVKSIFNNEVYFVERNQKIRIQDNNIAFINTETNDAELFSETRDYTVVPNISHVQRIIVKSIMPGSQVFWRNKLLGVTPILISSQQQKYNTLFIKHKDYITKQIKVNTDKNQILDIPLQKQYPPKLIWKQSLMNTAFIKPLMHNNAVFIADTSGKTYRIDKKTGNIEWFFNPGSRMSARLVQYKDKILVAYNNHTLYALNVQTGKEIWKTKIGILIDAAPQVFQERLYACNTEGVILCLDVHSGKILWQKQFDKGFLSSCTIEGAYLYVGGLSGIVYAVSLKDKSIRWTFRTRDKIVDSKPLIMANQIIIASTDQFVYAIDKYKGVLLWKFNTQSKIFTSPLKLKNSIIIANVSGDVFSINKDNGKEQWHFNSGAQIMITPEIINDHIYLHTGENLFIINEWGLAIDEYFLPSTTFLVSKKDQIYLCDREKKLIKVSINK